MIVLLTILLIGMAIALVVLAVVLADPRTRTPRRPLLLAAECAGGRFRQVGPLLLQAQGNQAP